MALYSKLMNNCDGIQGFASVDELGTNWEDAEDDDVRKAMKDKERWISRIIQLEDDFASYEGMVAVLVSGELFSSKPLYNEVRQLAIQVIEADNMSRGLSTLQVAPASLLESSKFPGKDA
jgi:hypothetical protein